MHIPCLSSLPEPDLPWAYPKRQIGLRWRLLWNLPDSLARVTYFGSNNTETSVLATDVIEEEGKLTFQVNTPDTHIGIALPLEGLHYVSDALAAIAVGMELGVDTQKIRQSLARFETMAGRQEIFEAKGCTIIKDCYNAGPESMAAALAVLGKRKGRKIAVLGDMLELGVCTQAEHYKIGRIAAQKADMVFAYGPNSVRVLNGCITGGMAETKARAFTDRDRLVDVLRQVVQPGDTLLIKGSRGMKMELVRQQLCGGTEND